MSVHEDGWILCVSVESDLFFFKVSYLILKRHICSVYVFLLLCIKYIFIILESMDLHIYSPRIVNIGLPLT